jgi:hypothetical protein
MRLNIRRPWRQRPNAFPLCLPVLKLWLRSGVGMYTTSGGATPAVADADPVGRWEDQSGNGNHVIQATSTKCPTLRLGIQNSRPVVRFDGVDDCLQSATFTLLTQPVTWFFALVRTGAPGGVDRVWFDGGNLGRQRLLVDGSTLVTDYISSTVFVGGGAWGTSWHAGSVLFNGASSVLRKDGAQVGAGDPGPDGTNRFTLGSNLNLTGNFMPGDLGELLVYSGDKTASFAWVEAYLKSRWATP